MLTACACSQTACRLHRLRRHPRSLFAPIRTFPAFASSAPAPAQPSQRPAHLDITPTHLRCSPGPKVRTPYQRQYSGDAANRFSYSEQPTAHGKGRPADCCRCSVPCARQQTACRLHTLRRHLPLLFAPSALHSFVRIHLRIAHERHYRTLPTFSPSLTRSASEGERFFRCIKIGQGHF